MSSYRYKIPRLERVTHAIGYVCVFWAWLEDGIGEMILDLAPLDRMKITEKEMKQLRDVILVDADIRSKIKILRAVAFIRKVDDAWFGKVDKVLNKIDNEHRPSRNRVVHGQWYSPKRGVERRSRHARLRRPQSFAKVELSTQERVPVKVREVWDLSKSLIRVQAKLAQLSLDHEAFQKAVDKQLGKAIAEDDAKRTIDMFAKDAAAGGPLLNSLLAIFLKQRPHQALGETHPKTPLAKQPPRQRSSRKKSPP